MNINAPILTAKTLGLVALACATLAGPLHAADQVVTVKIPVSAADLDLDQPAGAREMYRRVQNAAVIVCRSGNRVDLQAVPNFRNCYDKALAEAIRAVNRPQLTLIFMDEHGVQEAASRGIKIPVLAAAK